MVSQPKMDVRVRRATAPDLRPLGFFIDAVLRKDYFLRRGQLEELVNGPYHEVYVAEVDCVLVGLAIVTRGARLINALVHPAYRGLGIGKALVQASGAREVRAKLDMSSGDPRGFYESIGFSQTGAFNAKGNIAVMRRTGRRRRDAAPRPRAGRTQASAKTGGSA